VGAVTAALTLVSNRAEGVPHSLIAASTDAAIVLVVWSGGHLLVPLLGWAVASFAAHRIIGDKLVAHFGIIAAWVLAVALDNHSTAVWWVRYAEPASLDDLLVGEHGSVSVSAAGRALGRALYWLAVEATLLVVALRWRPRVGAAPTSR
jgi:hypothetical protein